MLYCKLLGAGVLLCCGLAVSVSAVALLRRRVQQTEGFLALLAALREQIDRYATPLRGALRALDPRLLAACGIRGQIETPEALLTAAPLYLSREAAEALELFARDAQGASREELLRRCDAASERLRLYHEAARRPLPRERQAAFFLPLAAAAALALLLL